MNNLIQEILKDLYQVDDTLRERENELVKIIQELLRSKPEAKIDENFVRELRQEILKRAKELKEERQAKVRNISWFSNLFPANKFAYALGGAVIVLIITVPLYSYINQKGKRAGAPEKLALDFNHGITEVKDQAFGALTATNQAKTPSSVQGLGGGGVARTESGGGGGLVTTEKVDAGVPSRPEYIQYKYVYGGDPINIEQNTMKVYRRIRSEAGNRSLAQYLTELDFDIFDLSQFKNALLTNLNLNEEREFGYSLNLNFEENELNIFQNWRQWPQLGQECQDLSAQTGEACYDQYRLKYADVPADDRLIATAKQFVKNYGVDLSQYGEPVVEDQWRWTYEQAEDKANVYIPEEISVIFPLIVDNQTVYDSNGNPTGLYVSVNVRYNRASGVRPIRPYNYESSSYDVITDSEEIIKLAEQGGLWPEYYYEEPTKTVEVKLGTPQAGLYEHYSYEPVKGQTSQLLVPALFFPIMSMSEEISYFYRQYIVVPLAKDIIKDIAGPVSPLPQPRLLEDEGQDEEAVVNEAEKEVFPQ
jgi:hypothetical protein